MSYDHLSTSAAIIRMSKNYATNLRLLLLWGIIQGLLGIGSVQTGTLVYEVTNVHAVGQ